MRCQRASASVTDHTGHEPASRSIAPRSAKVIPDPGTRSTTVRDTRTSWGPADAASAASHVEHRPAVASRSHSPMCTPAPARAPDSRARRTTAAPHCTARPGPSKRATRLGPCVGNHLSSAPRHFAIEHPAKIRQRLARGVDRDHEHRRQHAIRARAGCAGWPGTARSRRAWRPDRRRTAGDRRRAAPRRSRPGSAPRDSVPLPP